MKCKTCWHYKLSESNDIAKDQAKNLDIQKIQMRIG